MRDSIANTLAKGATPTTSPEFYVFIVVAGALLAWVAYLYFNRFKPAEQGGE